MRHEIVIKGRFPSYNEYTKVQRGNRYAGNKMKQDYQHICEWQIRQQLKGKKFRKPIKIHITCYEQRKNRDLDNVASFFFKVFLDALVKCQVIPNDNINNVTHISGTAAVDREHPRVVVIIEENENGRTQDVRKDNNRQ